MSANGNDLPRRDELACDAALFGLDEAELAELEGLDADADALLDLELAAGEIAARAYEAGEAERLPAALADRVLADLRRVTSEKAAPAAEDRHSPAAGDRHSPAVGDRHSRTGAGLEAEPPAAKVIPIDRGWRRAREAAPWILAAAAIALLIVGRLLPGGPVAGPGPAPTTDAGVETTPASAREALLAIAGTAQLAWKVTEDPSATGASGDVVWHNGVQRGYMRFRGLAQNDPGKVQYQLWIFDGERDDRYPVDGGVFNVGPDGEVVVPIEAKLHVNRPTLFAITVEKPGGVVVSKRERIVLTAAPPPT